MARLTCLSYNIRFVLDRHRERMPLIKQVLRDADVIGMQEVQNGGYLCGQDRELQQFLGDFAANSGPCFPAYIASIPVLGWLFTLFFASPIGLLFRDLYALFNSVVLEPLLCWVDGPMLFHTPVLGDIFYFVLGSGWSFGNCTLANNDLKPQSFPPLLLGGKYRIAQKTLVHVPRSEEDSDLEPHRVWIVNAHLSDTPSFPTEELRASCEAARLSEFLRIVAWVQGEQGIRQDDSIVIMGDLNSPPEESLHRVVSEQGFASAFKTANGEEPKITFHQNHECTTKDVGFEECLDYIFFRGPLAVERAALAGNQPHPCDKTLYPSDHFGVRATFRFL